MKQSVGVIKQLSFYRGFSVRNHAAAPSPGDGGGISRSFYITAAYWYVTDELLSHAAPAMTRLPSSVRSVCTREAIPAGGAAALDLGDAASGNAM